MKLEPQKARHPQLLYESKLYKILQGGVGIPHIRLVIHCVKLCMAVNLTYLTGSYGQGKSGNFE